MPAHTCVQLKCPVRHLGFFHHANMLTVGSAYLSNERIMGLLFSFLLLDTKKLDTAAVMSHVGFCSSGLKLSFVFLKSKKVDL